jgi:hypothetical protein
VLFATFDLPFSTVSDFSTLLANFILLGRILEATRNAAETRCTQLPRTGGQAHMAHRMFEVVEDAADDAQLEQRSG